MRDKKTAEKAAGNSAGTGARPDNVLRGPFGGVAAGNSGGKNWTERMRSPPNASDGATHVHAPYNNTPSIHVQQNPDSTGEDMMQARGRAVSYDEGALPCWAAVQAVMCPNPTSASNVPFLNTDRDHFVLACKDFILKPAGNELFVMGLAARAQEVQQSGKPDAFAAAKKIHDVRLATAPSSYDNDAGRQVASPSPCAARLVQTALPLNDDHAPFPRPFTSRTSSVNTTGNAQIQAYNTSFPSPSPAKNVEEMRSERPLKKRCREMKSMKWCGRVTGDVDRRLKGGVDRMILEGCASKMGCVYPGADGGRSKLESGMINTESDDVEEYGEVRNMVSVDEVTKDNSIVISDSDSDDEVKPRPRKVQRVD